MHPPIFFDPEFVRNVIAGYLLTLLGVGILLLAGVWWALSQDSSQSSPRSPAFRALCGLGWAVFVAGWVWQIVGYISTEGMSWRW
jgi:uncharacterized membrane protein